MSIKEQRNKKEFSARELGERSGVNYRTIQNMECGKNDVNTANLDTLCRIAIALDCTLFDILTDQDLKYRLKLAIKKKKRKETAKE